MGRGAGPWCIGHGAHPQLTTRGGQIRNAIETIAHTLLRRYGVVFRKVLEREKTRLPSWRELLTVYRRLEARGELRGGRFVQGFSGEQFALPDALASLRQVRSNKAEAELVAVSGADPLNLTGLITPGKRVPANAGNRVLYRNGVPVGALHRPSGGIPRPDRSRCRMGAAPASAPSSAPRVPA